jgi:hypothetical protein
MSISFVHLRRILFGTSCAIVFGFGASQALASPTHAAVRRDCEPWQVQECQTSCAYRGMVGYCANLGGGSYQCQCQFEIL